MKDKAINTKTVVKMSQINPVNTEQLAGISRKEASMRRQLTKSMLAVVHGDSDKAISDGL